MNSLDILERLIGFPTVSLGSNRDLIGFVRSLLREAGVEAVEVESPHAGNLNLFATIGPADRSGVVLSGHTDVVPVEGQAWTVDPFRLTRREDRLHGRGTADMKGFVACALRAASLAAKRELAIPLHLAFSCDEEVGCVGVRPMLDMLSARAVRPLACIIGEPTSMRLATGHKGKIALHVVCTGREGHSALAPQLLNAINLASEFVQAVAGLQADAERSGPRDEAYDVPYATLHVGRIAGGEALNIVPSRCMLDMEIRSADPAEAEAFLARITTAAAAIVASRRDRFPEADIAIEVANAYPGLNAAEDDAAAALVRRLIGANETMKVAFGTEGGLFKQALDVPTVICGPGSMDQGHKADEYVTVEQIARCDAMMDALVEYLATGG
jgi:acetylornithine deacetylase